jgi:phosphoglycerate dehydrogenase-like enzyme
MRDATVWVLARPEDSSLRVLDEAAPGARFVLGREPSDFAGQPAPDAMLVCSLGHAALEPVWALAPKTRWIHSRAAGVESLLFPALASSEAVLTNGRGVFSVSLAEFAIAALLYFARDFPRLVRNQRRRAWEVFEPLDLAGRTLAIVGYGDIGRATAERAHRLGMKVLALRRRPAQSSADPWVEETLPPQELLPVLRRADDVVVATPLTPETRGLLSEAAISALKPGAVLVNVGRGPVVDERALAQALAAGRLRGAALDVFESEPLPPDSPLWGLDNALLSPHCADNTPGWLEAAMRVFVQNLERYRRGERLRNVVDKRLGY